MVWELLVLKVGVEFFVRYKVAAFRTSDRVIQV